MTKKVRKYEVSLVRGPVVSLPPHPLSCIDADELLALAETLTRPLAADLFCGAGGLSLGLDGAGFEVVIGVDNDRRSLETHRAFFPGLTLERDLLSDEAIDEVSGLLKQLDVSLIAGGPPCQPFSRAGRSKIRHLVASGARGVSDDRSGLWRSFVEIVEQVQPPAVLLENVPDMALGDDMLVLRTIIDRLEAFGYAVHVRLLDAWRYGVPQHRQRLIVVARAEGADFVWPEERSQTVTVAEAIGDLPPVEGGWRPEGGAEGFAPYTHSIEHWFRKRARGRLRGRDRSRVYDHITRPVRPDDARAFQQMHPGGTYTDLDEEFKRYRDDIFDDKYKRLHPDELCRTITAHISQDGYWYIHPSQPRTLTVREAARIQTFPDRVRFAGPPSAAFRQIGNAVPPLLAEVVGRQIFRSLKKPRRARFGRFLVSEELAAWITEETTPRMPWLQARTPWAVLAGEMTLGRAPEKAVGAVWPVLSQLAEPEDFVERFDDLQRCAAEIGRTLHLPTLHDAAIWLVAQPEALKSSEQLVDAPGVTSRMAALVGLCGLGEDRVIASSPVLRVAARFWGTDVDQTNRLSHGRMAIGLMIGGGELARKAHVALFELASQLCRPKLPLCGSCPLATWCAYRSGSGG